MNMALLTEEQSALMSEMLVSNKALANDYAELDKLAIVDFSLAWEFTLKPHQIPSQEFIDPNQISLSIRLHNTGNGSTFMFNFYTPGLIGFGELGASGLEVAYSRLAQRMQVEIIDKAAALKLIL